MWELFIALFGGAYLASKASSDKRRTRAAIKKIEDDQKKLEIFRKSVTNNEMVSYVNDYMCMDDSGEKIEEELKELFSLIPELNGMEKYWRCYNNSPPAGNWLFIELILCINRGCVPLTKQFDFTVYPYYIGNHINGTPKYVAISEESCKVFAKWIVERLSIYGIKINLVYNKSGWINNLKWAYEEQ